VELFPENRLAAYQQRHKPLAKHLLSTATPESLSLNELLDLASAEERQLWDRLMLGYSSSQGEASLREAISAQYPGLDASNIVCFAGAQEAIFACTQALLGSADHVSAITPMFEPLVLTAQGLGAWINFCPMDYIADTGWTLDLDKWLSHVNEDTRLAIVNFPHNPTGHLLTPDEQNAIIDKARQNDVWLFSDEVYRGLEHDPQQRLTPVASLYEQGISLGVVSKCFGLGGVRVGWIATQDKALIKRLTDIKEFLSICNGMTDEVLATIAMRNADKLHARCVGIVKDNISLITTHQDELAFEWIPPMAGCLAFPRLKDFDDARDYSLALLQATGSLVLPGDCFLHGKEHIRLGLGVKNLPIR
jgi:aspartate/methionine/tyrosine aminotransferase